MGGGKILWTYAKPLLMGKILYTPNNVDIQQIITHVSNDTYFYLIPMYFNNRLTYVLGQ